MQDNTLNISAIIETIENELKKLDPYLDEVVGRREPLDARTLRLLEMRSTLHDTMATLSGRCERLGDDGDEGFIPRLGG